MISEGNQVRSVIGKKDGHLLDEAERLTDRNDVDYNDQLPQDSNNLQPNEEQNENLEDIVNGMDNDVDYNDKFPENPGGFQENENDLENPEEVDDFDDNFSQDNIEDNGNFDESDVQNGENIENDWGSSGRNNELQNSGRNDGLQNLQEYLPENYFNEKDASTKPPFSLDDIFNTFGSPPSRDSNNNRGFSNHYSNANRH